MELFPETGWKTPGVNWNPDRCVFLWESGRGTSPSRYSNLGDRTNQGSVWAPHPVKLPPRKRLAASQFPATRHSRTQASEHGNGDLLLKIRPAISGRRSHLPTAPHLNSA